jgi:hypothetical protein
MFLARSVNFGRIKIPQLEQAEGGLVRHRGHRLCVASPRPEQAGHHLPVLWRRKMRHPVDATAHPLPIPRADAIRVHLVRVPGLNGLLGGKVCATLSE